MLLIAAKFSQDEMPKIFDPGKLQDLKPQDFVVVPRGESQDVAFVANLEHKSKQQLKLRRDPYPRVLRRATEEEVEAWWNRKALERKAMVLCKEKARELNLDMKISHVRIDMSDNRAIFHFTSDHRVDFRLLVRQLSAILRMRIDLWQIGVRDEARMLDGYGICGLQTCCSSWLKEFRPITIRMAKDQDINLPPAKLSGQCGRLLCCLSYEVDQYKQLTKEALPKGATVRFDGKQGVIVDRNLLKGTYLVTDESGAFHTLKHEEIGPDGAKIPEQMKRFGDVAKQAKSATVGEMLAQAASEDHVVIPDDEEVISSPSSVDVEKAPGLEPVDPAKKKKRSRRKPNKPRQESKPQSEATPAIPPPPRESPGEKEKPSRKKRKKPKPQKDGAPPQPDQNPRSGSDQDGGSPKGRRKKRRK